MKKYCWLVLCITLFLACGKDGEMDVTDPRLTILSGLTEGKQLQGVAEVQFSVYDQGGAERVEIVLNDTEIITLQDPFLWTFETTNYEDGDYRITAKAIDKTGNESIPLDRTFSIKNAFLTLNVGIDYLEEGRHYFFVTNSNNEVVGATEIQNGNQYSFQRPTGFRDEVFNYHHLSVVRGDYDLKSEIFQREDVISFETNEENEFYKGAELGNADVRFRNIPDHNYFGFFPGVDENQGEDLVLARFNPILWENAQSYYLYLMNGHYMEGELEVGVNTLDLSNLSSEMDEFVFIAGYDIENFLLTAKDARDNRVKPFVNLGNGPVWTQHKTFLGFHLPEERSHLEQFRVTANLYDWIWDYHYISKSYSEQDVLVPGRVRGRFGEVSYDVDDINVQFMGSHTGVSVYSSVMVNQATFSWTIDFEQAGRGYSGFPNLPALITDNHPEFAKSVFEGVDSFKVTVSHEIKTEAGLEQLYLWKIFE